MTWIRAHADLIAQLATAAALVLGWLLVTLGVAAVAAPRVVWPISLGLLCISLGGWKLIVAIAVDGLYALTKD